MSGAVEEVDIHETIRLVEYDMLHRANPGCGDFTGVRSEVATIITALRAALTTPPARSYADDDQVYAKGRQDGYAAGRSHALDDAAKVADDYEQHTGDPAFDAATDVAAVTIGERIRLLSQGGKA